METICSSETPVSFYHITQRQTPKSNTYHWFYLQPISCLAYCFQPDGRVRASETSKDLYRITRPYASNEYALVQLRTPGSRSCVVSWIEHLGVRNVMRTAKCPWYSLHQRCEPSVVEHVSCCTPEASDTAARSPVRSCVLRHKTRRNSV
jgi:hypothetical protein